MIAGLAQACETATAWLSHLKSFSIGAAQPDWPKHPPRFIVQASNESIRAAVVLTSPCRAGLKRRAKLISRSTC